MTNRPVNFNDPTGHKETTDTDGGRMCEEEPCLVGDLACQLEKGGYKQKSKEQIIREIDGLRPDGWKRSITLAARFPSNLNANGEKSSHCFIRGIKPCHR